MGAFFTNFHVRNASTAAVCAAVSRLVQSRAYVSREKTGWVTVYTEATEDQNTDTMGAIAGGLSKALKTDVLGFLAHDSDVVVYWLYRDGTLVDEFNSAPDYFDEDVDDRTRARLSGNTDALLPRCVDGTTRAHLEDILHPTDGLPLMAEQMRTFSQMFGNRATDMVSQLHEGFDRAAVDMLKISTLSDKPTIDELKTARDQGPEALAAFLARRTPEQLTDIGIGAAMVKNHA